MTLDDQGNVIVAGWTTSFLGDYDYLTLKYDAEGKLLWSRSYDGPGHGEDFASAVAVEPVTGRIFVHGHSLGAGTGADYATLCYTANGNLAWEQRYDGPASRNDYCFGLDQIGLDAAGNVYVSGYSEDAVGYPDFATIKYSSNGALLWARHFSSPNGNNPKAAAYGLSVTPSGNVYVSGDGISPGGSGDYTLVKYDSNGNEAWVRQYDGPAGGDDGVYSMTIDDAENVYLIGIVRDAAGAFDYGAVKYDKDGNFQWAGLFGNQGFDYGWSADVAPNGDVAVTGAWMTGGGEYDIVTVKYNAAGVQQWAARYRPNWFAEDWGWRAAFDADGSVFVAGYAFNGYGSGRDVVLLKYDSNGNSLWTQLYNGALGGNDAGQAMVLDQDHNIYVAGYSLGENSQTDALLLKFSDAPCTGSEAIKSAKCKVKVSVGQVSVKLEGGLSGDTFTVELSSGEIKEGKLKSNGTGKAKIKNVPLGPGTATVTWGCGATATATYSCS